MKKNQIIAAAFAAALILCSCGDSDTADAVSPTTETSAVSVPETVSTEPTETETSAAADITETTESQTEADVPSEDPVIVSSIEEDRSEPSDGALAEFDGSSMTFYTYHVEEDGYYSFEHEGESGTNWLIYVLDEEFSDAFRYLFSNYEPDAESDAVLHLTAGQYAYCICSVNEWNSSEPPYSYLTISMADGELVNEDYEDVNSDNADDDDNESYMTSLAEGLFNNACETQWDYLCSDGLFKLDPDSFPEDENYANSYYHKIIGYDTYEEASAGYFDVFSNQYHENDLASKLYSDDTGVYTYEGARGTDITYVGSEVTSLNSLTESTAEFTVTNTYTDRVESAEFSLVYERGAWRVGKFTLPY